MFRLILFLLLSSSYAISDCLKGGVMTMNGNTGPNDNCEFYLDIYRMEKLASSPECHKSLVPQIKPTDFSSCNGYVGRYFKSGVKATPSSFQDELEKTLMLGGNKSLVTITDHGNKEVLKDCKSYSLTCVEKKFERESSFSVGDGSVNESQLREILLHSREKQKKELCRDKSEDCKLPPLIMNFDHCYSGGMQNSFFDQNGKPLENICGISAASENEYSYTGENIAKGINELRYGVGGIYKDDYRKFDKDKDGKFSVSEVYDYINLKAKRSVPLKTSDKFLLDHFSKSQLDISSNLCTLEKAPQLEVSSNLGEISYSSHLEKFHKTAQIFLERGQEINQSTLDELQEEEKQAQRVMMMNDDQQMYFQKIEDAFYEDVGSHGYLEITKVEQELEKVIEERIQLEDIACLADQECSEKKEKMKVKESEIGLESNEDLQVKLYEEYSTSLKDYRKSLEKLVDTSCDGKCPELGQKKLEVSSLKGRIKSISEKLITEKSEDLIEKNKQSMMKYFEKMEALLKPYRDSKLNSFLEIEKEKMLNDKYLLKSHPNDFFDGFSDFHSKIQEEFNHVQLNAHQKYIKSRKAVNQLKMSSALSNLIQTSNKEKLEQYEMIKECENTPLFDYKR